MLKSALLLSVALTSLIGSSIGLAQSVASPVADVINARRGLMNQLGALQSLVDTRIANGDFSAELYDLSQAAAASIDAFAVLLPEESNLLGGAPAIEGTDTTAAANVWDDLPAFQKLLHDAASDARSASEAADMAGFTASWSKVTASCASCHETYVVFDPFAGLN